MCLHKFHIYVENSFVTFQNEIILSAFHAIFPIFQLARKKRKQQSNWCLNVFILKTKNP